MTTAFYKAAEKLLKADLLVHHLACNYQSDIGNGLGRCNCGVSDMLSAMKVYDRGVLRKKVRRLFKRKYSKSVAPAKDMMVEMRDELLQAAIPEEDHLIVMLDFLHPHPQVK